MTTEHTPLNQNEDESHINFLYAHLKKRIYSHPAVEEMDVCTSPSIDRYSDYRITIYIDPNKVANVANLSNHEYQTVCNSLLDKVDDIVRPLLMLTPEDSTYPGIGLGEDVSIDYFLTVDQVRSLMELYSDGQSSEESGTRPVNEPYIITKEDIPDRQRLTKEVKDTVDRATHNFHLYAIQYDALNHSMSHFMNILKQVVREFRNNGKNGDILFPLTNEVYFTYDGFENDVKIPYHFTHLKWTKDDKVTLEGDYLDTGGDKEETFAVSFTFTKLPTEVIIDVIRELGFLFW